ncbi:Lachrymatory-factor synthase [Linum grandiflorum]
MFTDFFNIHKWFPNLPSSYGIHGTNGQPGCIRYCSGFSLPSTQLLSWSKERLTALDHSRRFLTYQIVDCNIGFKSYQSTVQIFVDDDGGQGCLIEWGFTLDPLEGWTLDDLVKRFETVLNAAARKMEEEHVIGSI